MKRLSRRRGKAGAVGGGRLRDRAVEVQAQPAQQVPGQLRVLLLGAAALLENQSPP
ncbi:hypothetical protein LJK87_32140 [Paenibacillus sp. P25]|nr:hypothetical protein LJK87_32140 [Paenibacillus sp. P25]